MKLECGCARWARMLQHCTWWPITCCISDVLACLLNKSLYLSPSFIFCQASGIVIERRLVPHTHATCSKASQKKKKNATNWDAWPGDRLRGVVVQHFLFSPGLKSQLASKRCKTRHSATCSSVKYSAIANHLTLRKQQRVEQTTHEMLAQNRTQPLIFSGVVLLKVRTSTYTSVSRAVSSITNTWQASVQSGLS